MLKRQYIDSLKPQLRDLLRTILLNGYVSHDRANEILVKNDDMRKFETQLKKHGYLL